MRLDTIHILAVALMLSLTAQQRLDAQTYVNTPVEISKEKVRIDGKICYSHIVLERQTLYSISKAYGVTLEDIYRFNPTVKEVGLKKNSIIIIPSQDAIKSSVTVQMPEPAKAPEAVKEEPAVKRPEKPRQAPEVKAPVKEKTRRIHIAKWYEDLDVIAEQYGVTVDDIMKANNLTGRKLVKRQKLIIPYPGEETVTKPTVVAEVAPTPQVPAEETVAEVVDSVTIEPVSKVNLSLVMPLTNSEGEPHRNNMDFYCGALLAVYDMANEGIDCNLNVCDIMNADSGFDMESLTKSDMIIGPVSTADLTRMFNAVPAGTTVVSPLDPRAEKLITEHSSMIQIPTPHQVQNRDLIKWMEEDFTEGDRAVMITEKGARQTGIVNIMKEALDSSSLAYQTFSYSILEGRDVTEALTGLMSEEGKNRIVIASESEAFVNDVVRNLNLLIYNNLDIVLYAPSKIRGFDTIEVENLHKTSTHVSLAYYVDYESPLVKEFLLKYRALFNTEPNQFAFQGYDVTRYFASQYTKAGKNWKEGLDGNETEMLQSTFMLRRQPSGGHLNNGIRRIVYDNGYSIKRVK